jgi:hypothetical protein
MFLPYLTTLYGIFVSLFKLYTMQTYLIMSHGSHCPVKGSMKAEVITLPDNVVVVMNCHNSYMYATDEFDAACWAFVADKDLHLSMRKTRFRVKNFAKYMQTLANLTISEEKNNFCVFTEKCPNLELTKEDIEWRSAAVKAPVKIALKDYATELKYDISHELLTKISKREALTHHEKFLKRIWFKPKHERKYVYQHEGLSIKPAMIHFGMDKNPITLKQFVKQTSESDPTTMHVILVTACRSPDIKVESKLRQYETKYQPYESAIVVYDKLMKLRQKKNVV